MKVAFTRENVQRQGAGETILVLDAILNSPRYKYIYKLEPNI